MHDIDDAAGEFGIDPHLRIALQIRSNPSTHRDHPELDPAGELEHPTRLALGFLHRTLRIFDRCQDAHSAFEELAPDLSQRERARRAFKQACAQLLFQLGDHPREVGLLGVQRIRGAGEAAGLHHFDEGL